MGRASGPEPWFSRTRVKPPPKTVSSLVWLGGVVMAGSALVGVVGLILYATVTDALRAGAGADEVTPAATFLLVTGFLGVLIGAYLINLGTSRGISRR